MSTAAAAMHAPDALDRFGERLADRVNPIIVKELRQGLRTRIFWIFFSLMLVACLFISLGFFAAAGEATSSGQYAFIAYFVCLGLVQFFVIPYSAYRSMARETEEETWVLLTLTGLGPRKILAGKLGSYVLQGLLYSSAAAPFLLFSYYLNGIDLPTIIASVVVAVAYQVFLVSISVSLATLAETRIVRALLHFVLLGMLLPAVGIGIGVTASATELSRKLIADNLFWFVFALVFFFVLTTGLLLFESAAARLSLPTEEYARGPRLLFLVQFVGGVVFFVIGHLLVGKAEVLAAGAVTMAAYATLVGLFVASDRDSMARLHWATGKRYSLLKPGAFRGYLLTQLCLAGLAVIFLALAARSGHADAEDFALILGAPAFALIYTSAPNVVARWIPHPPYQTPAMVRIVFLGLIVLATGVPPLVGEIFSEPDDLLLNALNPIVGLVNIAKAGVEAIPLLLVAWAVGIGLAVWTMFTLRARDVEPLA